MRTSSNSPTDLNGNSVTPQHVPARTQAMRVTVKLDIEVTDQPVVTTSIQADGETPDAVAAVIAAAVSAAMTTALRDPSLPEPSAELSTTTAKPAPEKTKSPAQVAATPPASATRARNAWISRNSRWISAGFGAALVLLAVLIPLIAPPQQRGQVLIMTVLFGLTGALLLGSSALDAGRRRETATAPVQRMPVRLAMERGDAAAPVERYGDIRTRQLPARQSKWRAALGFVFGCVFALAGVIAPFALSVGEGTVDADARFLMVLGFSPVAISGVLLVVLFWRMLKPPQTSLSQATQGSARPAVTTAAPARRARVPRVPGGMVYRVLIPAAIVLLVALIVVVIAVVAAATITPLMR